MTGHNESIQQPKWKDWLRRFWNGYKFSNLGFKRLFIVGLVGIPLFIGVVMSITGGEPYEREFTFDDFFGVMFVSLLAYLLVVPIARWAYGGFSITGVKRLFVVGLVGVPLFTAIVVSKPDDSRFFRRSYIEDFLPAMFLTLLGYLVVVRAARWVCDGFHSASRQATEVKPDTPDAWYNLAHRYREQGKHDDAETAFRQAIKIKPDYPEAWYCLSLTYGKQGKRTEALDALDHLRQLDPSQADKLADFLSSK